MNHRQLPAVALLTAALFTMTACSSGDGSDEATPASSPSSSETTPAAELIDYEKDGAKGVSLRKPADVAKITGAPDDFKQFMAGFVDATVAGVIEQDPECPMAVTVDRFDTSGYASGVVGDCGGAAAMWGKRDGIWQQIWVGQTIPECSDMTKYSVPQSIAGDRCWDGKKDIAYSG